MSRVRITRLAPVLLMLATGIGVAVAQNPDGVVSMTAPEAIDEGLTLASAHGPDAPGPRVAAPQTLRTASLRVGESGAAYDMGKVIVKYRDGTAAGARQAMSRMATVVGSVQPSSANFDVMQIDPAVDAEAFARVLASRPDVEYAQPAYRVHTQFVPNDPLYPKQWNLPQMGLERAWDIQRGSAPSIVVAVLDTGVAFTNATMRYTANAFGYNGILYPALGALTLPFVSAPELGPAGRFVAPRDFIWNSTLPLDLDGHGTHVAGTIGQLTNDGVGTAGVAFNASIMPVKVVGGVWDDAFGSPEIGTDDSVARGLRYAADNGARVINMSIGRTGPPAPAIEDAMRYAIAKGAFIAVAAGNGGEIGNPTEVLAAIAGRLDGAMAVGAVDRTHARAFYSTIGPDVEITAPGGSFRNVGAEGGILQQTYDLGLVETYSQGEARFTAPRFDTVAYIYFTGTSQATPHISGLAALLMQQGLTNPAAIEAAIKRFAVDRGQPGRDDEFGFGEVDARATLRGLGLAR